MVEKPIALRASRRGLSVSAQPKTPHGSRYVCQGVRKIRLGNSLCFLDTSPSPVCARLSPGLQDLCLACVSGAQTPIQTVTGLTWSQLVSSNPKFANFLGSTLVDDGISGVGLALFGMVVSFTGYRKGEKWAWYVSWSMPIGILAAQLNVYALTGSIMVI